MKMDSSSSLSGTYARLWALLLVRFRWAAVVLLVATIMGSLLEVLGLVLLGLLLSALTSNPSTPTAMWLQELSSTWLGSGSPHSQVLLILGLCGFAFLFKNLFLAVHAWFEATFAFQLQAKISEQLIHESLSLDYESAVKRSPSEYISLLTADLGSLVFHTLLPALTLLSEVVMLVAVFVFLVWSQPTITLAVSIVLGLIGFAMIRISRSSVSQLSRRRQSLEDARTRNLQQTFGNLRDVYIYGAAGHFKGVLSSSMTDLAFVYRGYQMMATGPRFVLEFALVAVLLAVIAFGLKTPGNSALIASVGVFAASGFRLLIGANRLVMSAQSIRFGHSALCRVWDALLGLSSAEPALETRLLPVGRAGCDELRMSNVSYRYPGGDSMVLNQVSLTMRRGEMIGIAGPSGSGKSTILDVLSGLRRPQEGCVTLWCGTEMVKTIQAPISEIGYVGQNAILFSTTLRNNIAFGVPSESIDDEAIWRALKLSQLTEFVRILPLGLETPMAEVGVNLSGGQIQRVGIARALYSRNSFLLLDEPTSALDKKAEMEVVSTLRQLANTCGIVIVSHRATPLNACDRVYEFQSGRLQLKTGGAQ